MTGVDKSLVAKPSLFSRGKKKKRRLYVNKMSSLTTLRALDYALTSNSVQSDSINSAAARWCNGIASIVGRNSRGTQHPISKIHPSVGALLSEEHSTERLSRFS